MYPIMRRLGILGRSDGSGRARGVTLHANDLSKTTCACTRESSAVNPRMPDLPETVIDQMM